MIASPASYISAVSTSFKVSVLRLKPEQDNLLSLKMELIFQKLIPDTEIIYNKGLGKMLGNCLYVISNSQV